MFLEYFFQPVNEILDWISQALKQGPCSGVVMNVVEIEYIFAYWVKKLFSRKLQLKKQP